EHDSHHHRYLSFFEEDSKRVSKLHLLCGERAHKYGHGLAADVSACVGHHGHIKCEDHKLGQDIFVGVKNKARCEPQGCERHNPGGATFEVSPRRNAQIVTSRRGGDGHKFLDVFGVLFLKDVDDVVMCDDTHKGVG